MRKIIVSTTINPPTEAIRKFDSMEDWELVVMGDLKTPKDYQLQRGLYMSPAEQEQYDKPLSDAIGWNCIQRRNFGLLIAHDRGADIVAVIDDDNIPLPGWGTDLMLRRDVEVNHYETTLPAFDPVGATNHSKLWHRGFPLQLLSRRDYNRKSRRIIRPMVQADFWNGDPDIDAICRMEHAPECTFDPAYFPIASNAMSPFNSQNTFLDGAMLGDYFLFPFIGRMDDIWAAFYVQAKGHQVVFGKASVYQLRNEHDLVRDMKSEYPGYENDLEIVSTITKDAEALLSYVPGRAIRARQLSRRHFGIE